MPGAPEQGGRSQSPEAAADDYHAAHGYSPQRQRRDELHARDRTGHVGKGDRVLVEPVSRLRRRVLVQNVEQRTGDRGVHQRDGHVYEGEARRGERPQDPAPEDDPAGAEPDRGRRNADLAVLVHVLHGVEGVLGRAPRHEPRRRRPDRSFAEGERHEDEREGVGGVAQGVQVGAGLEARGRDRVADEDQRVEEHPGHRGKGQDKDEVDQERHVREYDAERDKAHLRAVYPGPFQGALAGVLGVCLLVEDVVDAVDQEVERQREPEQNRKRLPAPQIPGEPHPDRGRPQGVDPEHGPRDVKETQDHAPNIYQRAGRQSLWRPARSAVSHQQSAFSFWAEG